MAKYFQLSDENTKLVEEKFNATGLYNYIDLKMRGITKSKELISVKKTSAIAEELGNCPNSVICVIYEDAFDRLDKERKQILLEDAFASVSFDVEKDKIKVGVPHIEVTIGGLDKHGKILVDAAEAGVLAIQQIEDEKKENG